MKKKHIYIHDVLASISIRVEWATGKPINYFNCTRASFTFAFVCAAGALTRKEEIDDERAAKKERKKGEIFFFFSGSRV